MVRFRGHVAGCIIADVSVVRLSFLVRGADHMLSEKSQWTQNGTMFVDLD